MIISLFNIYTTKFSDPRSRRLLLKKVLFCVILFYFVQVINQSKQIFYKNIKTTTTAIQFNRIIKMLVISGISIPEIFNLSRFFI